MPDNSINDAIKEKHVLNTVVEYAKTKHFCFLFRNNSGGMKTKNGYVKFGLGAFDAESVAASSDLIGIMPVTITQEMVGENVGVFVAIECKRPNFRKDVRYLKQKRFIDFIKKTFGLAGFATCTEDVDMILTGRK